MSRSWQGPSAFIRIYVDSYKFMTGHKVKAMHLSSSAMASHTTCMGHMSSLREVMPLLQSSCRVISCDRESAQEQASRHTSSCNITTIHVMQLQHAIWASSCPSPCCQSRHSLLQIKRHRTSPGFQRTSATCTGRHGAAPVPEPAAPCPPDRGPAGPRPRDPACMRPRPGKPPARARRR